MTQRRVSAIVVGVVLVVMRGARAEEVLPVGPEFRVSRQSTNYYATYDGRAYDPEVSREPNGQFVVVWSEYVQKYGPAGYGQHSNVEARHFNRDGTGTGNQFTVFASPDEDPFYPNFRPAVTADTSNGFVVVWSNRFDTTPTFGRIWARRYDSNSNALGPRFQVNTLEAGANSQARLDVVRAADGGFLVTWDAWDPEPLIMARRYDASGVAGPEFQVNTDPLSWYGYPSAGASAAGDFVVAWTDFGASVPDPDAGPAGMFGQRLDGSGAPVGTEFQVFDHDNDEVKNHIAVAPDGSFFVLGWHNGMLTGRIYSPGGVATTSEFAIDAAATDYGTVEADPDGNFVVAWAGDTNYGPIQGKRFSNGGAPLGAVFQVSEQPLYARFEWPELTTDEDGDFVVVWSNGYYASDGEDSYGVWARRLRVCGNGRVGPDDACDDGNTTALDGCSATCRVETCHTCSGQPSTCPQLPSCTGVCTDPAPIQPNTAVLTMTGLGAPTGDEGLAFKGKIANPPLTHLEFDPSIEGVELALTTTNVVYRLMGATRVPPGLVGSGCDPVKDGWRVKPPTFVYKNVSGALPPACVPGSANGLRVVKLKDKLDRDATLQFRVKARNAMIDPPPAPPLVATIILGESPAAGAAGRCGQITFTGLVGSRFFP